MSKQQKEAWTGEMGAIGEELERWQAEHPDATMREIELKVEQVMAQLGVQMMAGLAMERERGASGVEVRCPQCGGPTMRRGRRQRKLKGAHDESVVLTRQYVTCQECGHGFFPSGQGVGAG